ncbi:hypothetical protein BN1708_004354 [Verticillium longisporum]|uniref:C2H2-type domain-containing protein n=1 Tax=Verticillium longisporum TaxID=100787 RepID=A0A0G4LZX8_VERLO|nr:hypothetical protein BN1708_004354 [Verticillium longisporum]
MPTWDCPNCIAPCGDAKELVHHVVSSHLTGKTPASSSLLEKRKRQPSTIEDEEADRQLDFVCPFPRCEHKKQYPSKFNLLRHFFIHYPDSEDEYLRCPCCLKLKENLGALSAHWEKSCKRKLGKYDLIKEEERRRLEFFEDKKAEMGVRLTTALNEALFAPRKQARQGQPDASGRSRSGGEVDISFTAELCQSSSSKETAMPSARPQLGPSHEGFTNGAVSNPTSAVPQVSGTSKSNVGQACITSTDNIVLPDSDTTTASPVSAFASIHGILSTFDTSRSADPPFGDDYDSLEGGNRWWMTHETDLILGHHGEQMTDSDWSTDTGLEPWILNVSSHPSS